jgi:hypothetical protein
MVAACLVLCGPALIACSTQSTPVATPPTTAILTPSGPDALKAALDRLTGASYDFTAKLVDRNSTTVLVGSVDGRTRAKVTVDGNEAGSNIHLETIIINGDGWFKIDSSSFDTQFGVDPTKWMKADLSRLNHRTGPPDLAGLDVLDTHGLFTTIGPVTRTDSTHMTGTVDLTAATGDVSDPATIAAAGAAAKSAPFLVSLDDQGRISHLSYSVPGTKTDFQVQYTNYGSPSLIEPPDATGVIPMPDKVYPALNS